MLIISFLFLLEPISLIPSGPLILNEITVAASGIGCSYRVHIEGLPAALQGSHCFPFHFSPSELTFAFVVFFRCFSARRDT